MIVDGLIEYGDKILVGFSGGADSVCLLHYLYTNREKLGIEVMAAHINHGLRENSADSDELFCKEFCEKRGISFFVKHADVRAVAKQNGVSEETAGRNVRYDFFNKICADYGINKIATAHHKNDLAETVVMNFIRGAGIKGLAGIPSVRDNIIRPMLDMTRKDVENYCRENKLDFVTDETNFENVYRRNKIRLDLIPYIQKEFNSGFVNSVTENAKNIADDNAFIEAAADSEFDKRVSKEKNGFSLIIDNIPNSIRRRIFIRMMERCGVRDIALVHIKNVDELWDKNETGKMCNLPSNTIAKTMYGRLYIVRACDKTEDFEYDIKIGECTAIPEAGITILVQKDDKNGTFMLDGDLKVRSRHSGDIFYPSGMKGKKKVKDYFVNEKIPSEERAKIPLLICGGEVAMIIGKRRDRRFIGKGYSVKIEKMGDV